MLIKVKVHPNSSRDEIIRRSSDSFEVFVRAKPIEGKANESVARLISDYLNTSRQSLRLIRGSNSRNKIFQVPDKT